MDVKELSKNIDDRVVAIGTAIEHMKSILKYSENNEGFRSAFVVPLFSLQNYVHIELFKLFDKSGKDSRENSIYGLMDKIGGDYKIRCYRKLSAYNSDIKSIQNRRNHYFAHDLGNTSSDIFSKNRFHEIEELLGVVAEICWNVNDELYLGIHTHNVRDFDNWCNMAVYSLREVCNLNDKLFTNSIPRELYDNCLDEFIDILKQIQRRKYYEK